MTPVIRLCECYNNYFDSQIERIDVIRYLFVFVCSLMMLGVHPSSENLPVFNRARSFGVMSHFRRHEGLSTFVRRNCVGFGHHSFRWRPCSCKSCLVAAFSRLFWHWRLMLVRRSGSSMRLIKVRAAVCSCPPYGVFSCDARSVRAIKFYFR